VNQTIQAASIPSEHPDVIPTRKQLWASFSRNVIPDSHSDLIIAFACMEA